MAGDAETDQRSSPCAWRIDRFDLIFYNARHKRWQFFAEDPAATEIARRAEGEGLHRYQIRSLLGTFRQAVQSVLSLPANEEKLFEIRSYVKGPNDDRIALSRPDFGAWKDYERIYLDYLISTGWYDGIPEGHRQGLQTWFNNPAERVSREAALTFLSLLPIFEDWDTWGCFIRGRNGPASSVADSFPPAIARTWSDPLYVVELDFRSKEPLAVAATTSKQFLDYPVTIEGLSLNLAAESFTPSHSPKADFFDSRYCKYPTGDEVIPYRFYAALVDPIMKGLVGEPEQRQFVIAYPVATGGRLHFLQVALSSSGQSAHSRVDALWNDWLAIHRALWRPTFRGFLQEEIYRITASAFQSEVHDKFADEIKRDGKINAQHYADALSSHIYHLFPVQAVETSSDTFGYARYRFPKKQWRHPLYDPNRLLLVGSEWKAYEEEDEREEPSSSVSRTIPVHDARITVGLTSSDAIHEVVEDHRIRQAIEQQNQFLVWLPDGLHKARLDAESDRQTCLRIVVEHGRRVLAEHGEQAFDPNSPDLPRLITEPIDFATLTSGIKGPEGREPYEWRYHPRSFGRYLEQAFKQKEVSDQLRSLMQILRPSTVLLQLSEYFETGPARIASHSGIVDGPNPYFNGDLDDVKVAVAEHYGPLSSVLAGAINTVSGLKSALKKPNLEINRFHQLLEKQVSEATNLTDLEDTLRAEHHAFRVESMVVFGREIKHKQDHLRAYRCYGLDPLSALEPFLSVVKDHADRYLPVGRYTRRLRWTQPYGNRWSPPVDQFPCVRLVEHYLVFGTKEAVDVEALASTGEICKVWREPQEAVARLLIFTGSQTCVFCRNTFLPDPDLHAKLAGDQITTDILDQGAKGCVIVKHSVISICA